jgi:hypothetical protein
MERSLIENKMDSTLEVKKNGSDSYNIKWLEKRYPEKKH